MFLNQATEYVVQDKFPTWDDEVIWILMLLILDSHSVFLEPVSPR